MNNMQQSVKRMAHAYVRVLSLVWHTNPRYMLLALLLSLVSATSQPAYAWIVKLVIDRVTQLIQISNQGEPIQWTAIFTPMAAVLIIWVVSQICESRSRSFLDLLADEVRHYAERLLLKKAVEFDMAFYETPTFYDQLENARRDMWRAANLTTWGIDFLSAITALSGMTLILVRLQPLAVLILLASSIPEIFVQTYYANQIFKLWTSRTTGQRMVYYTSTLLTDRNSVKEMRLFELADTFLERHHRFWHQFTSEIRGLKLARERLNLGLSILAMIGTITAWGLAAMRAITGLLSVGDVALIFQGAGIMQTGLRRVLWNVGYFYENSLFVENFFKFLDLAPDAVAGALQQQTGPRRPVPDRLQQGIEFRNVSFRYPGAESWTLQNLSFTIHPHETVALVGENGAGKTTLIKLLTRLYDPTEGVILLDGCDLRDYDLASLRRAMGVIFQDFVRYSLSVRENIGFGQVDRMTERERVTWAADQGGAQPVINKLEKGIETVLGRTFDEGVDLSGGEWQKIALSRAFMRDAQILILDEPTSALDALAESTLYERFAELTADKTTIFISHRFSTVRIANHIIVIEQGRLVEEGDHVALMAMNGRYAAMFTKQAERYW